MAGNQTLSPKKWSKFTYNSSDTIGAVFIYKKLHLSVEYILKIW